MAPDAEKPQTSLIQNGINNMSVTSVQQNSHLLNTSYKFKRGAPLKIYLNEITRKEQNYYTLAEILTIIKRVISDEKMFDTRNPSVILCSKSLEEALDQKALHVTEVRDIVLGQLERIVPSRSSQIQLRPTCQAFSRGPAVPLQAGPPPSIIRTANIVTNTGPDKDSKYYMKPLFLVVVRLVPSTDHNQIIFTYEDATLLLSKYILSKKDVLFDPRNIKLALVKGDPLGDAFGVSAFHRCQVNALLRQQLIPVDSHPDVTTNVSISSSPGLSVSSEQTPVPIVSLKSEISPNSSYSSLPPFPALVKAASTPSTSTRKRSNSTEKSDEDFKAQKQPRRNVNQCCVIVRKSGDSEIETDTETIYSEQGYDTIKEPTEEEAEEDGSSTDMDEGDTTREVFDVEYDIDSGEEEERPPQAHGKGSEFSSADDTDTEIDEKHRVAFTSEKTFESVYWADSEEEAGTGTEENILTNKKQKGWKCLSCQKPNPPFVLYCPQCWDIRKGWAPERPKNKKKIRKSKDVKVTALISPDSGTDDTDGCQERPRSETMSSQDSGIGSQEMELAETELVVGDVDLQKPYLDLTKFNRSLSLDVTSEKSSSSSLGSTIDVSDLSELGSATDLRSSRLGGEVDLCLFCEIRPRNATFVHGRLGHQVCCYPCAKKSWKNKPTCPVCKRKIEKIVKLIQA